MSDANAPCDCGSEWWKPVADGEGVGPLVVLSYEGSVVGYAGWFECPECQTRWTGPYTGLRVVDD